MHLKGKSSAIAWLISAWRQWLNARKRLWILQPFVSGKYFATIRNMPLLNSKNFDQQFSSLLAVLWLAAQRSISFFPGWFCVVAFPAAQKSACYLLDIFVVISWAKDKFSCLRLDDNRCNHEICFSVKATWHSNLHDSSQYNQHIATCNKIVSYYYQSS